MCMKARGSKKSNSYTKGFPVLRDLGSARPALAGDSRCTAIHAASRKWLLFMSIFMGVEQLLASRAESMTQLISLYPWTSFAPSS